MELQEALGVHLHGRVSSDVKLELTGRLLTYIYRGPMDIKRLTRFVKDNDIPFDLTNFRRDLATSGELLYGSKTYLYSQVASKYQADVQPLTVEDCSVSSKEARLLMATAHDHALLSKTLVGYAKQSYRSLHPSQLQRLITEVLCTEDYEKYVSKYVHRKMRFLIQSFGYVAADLINDVRRWSMYAILRTYPAFNDYGHVLGLAKSTAHNMGVNLIKQATTAGRQRLTRDNQSLLVPLHVTESSGGANVADHDGILVDDSYLVVGRTGTRVQNDELDTYASLQALLESPRLRDEHKRFLRIMMGQHDDEFSAWLGQANEDAVEKNYDRYLARASEFIGVEVDEAKRFLRKLAQFL
jgi:hypothetical protein